MHWAIGHDRPNEGNKISSQAAGVPVVVAGMVHTGICTGPVSADDKVAEAWEQFIYRLTAAIVRTSML